MSMRNRIIKKLQLPRAIVTNNHIPKKSFFKNAELTKAEVNLFTSEIEGVYLLGVISPDYSNVPSYQTDEFHYREIYWVYANLRSDKHVHRISKAIHKSLPNPVVLILGVVDEKVAISTAHKRLNKQDNTKVVLEEQSLTHWFHTEPMEEAYANLLDNIKIEHLANENMYEFYEDMNQWIKVEGAIEYTKNLPEKAHRHDVIIQLDNIASLKKERKKFDQEEKETVSFGDKMQLHMQRKKINQKISNTIETLKELC